MTAKIQSEYKIKCSMNTFPNQPELSGPVCYINKTQRPGETPLYQVEIRKPKIFVTQDAQFWNKLCTNTITQNEAKERDDRQYLCTLNTEAESRLFGNKKTQYTDYLDTKVATEANANLFQGL